MWSTPGRAPRRPRFGGGGSGQAAHSALACRRRSTCRRATNGSLRYTDSIIASKDSLRQPAPDILHISDGNTEGGRGRAGRGRGGRGAAGRGPRGGGAE